MVLIIFFSFLGIRDFYARRLNIKAINCSDNTMRIDIFLHAIDINPRNPIYYINSSSAYALSDTNSFFELFLQGKRIESEVLNHALWYAQKALQIDSTNVLFCQIASIICCLKGNVISAKSLLECHNDKMSLIIKGIMAENDFLIDEALCYYSRALAIAPDIVHSRFFKDLSIRNNSLATCVIANAADLLEEEYGVTQSVIVLAKMGKIMLVAGDLNKACDILCDVVRQLPNMNRPYLYLGNIAEARNDTLLALEYYETATMLDKTDLLALYYLNKLKDKKSESIVNYIKERKIVTIQYSTSYIYNARLMNNKFVDGIKDYISPMLEHI